MEDTLWAKQNRPEASHMFYFVLILILMEDSLWDVNLVFNERIDGLS